MSRDELTEQIALLAKVAHQDGFPGTSGVLYALAGSLAVGTDGAMLNYVAEFCKTQLAEVQREIAIRKGGLN